MPVDQALRAIAEPNRRHILDLVRDGELSAGEISEHFDVTRPAVSQHLSVLKQAGLLVERRNGTRRLYRARPQGLAELKRFLDGFWDERLVALRRQAERREEPDPASITERLSVERVIVIAARPETVWELLVDAEQATRWMGRSASFDLRPGGRYRVEVIPGQVASGEFVEIDPPRRLVYTWGWETDGETAVPPGSTTVVFELRALGDRTLLRLSHHDLPSVDTAGSHSRGWGHYLNRLATSASGGDPGSDPWITDPELLRIELRP